MTLTRMCTMKKTVQPWLADVEHCSIHQKMEGSFPAPVRPCTQVAGSIPGGGV